MLDPLATTPGRKIGLLHDQKELSELSVHDDRSGLSTSWKNDPQSVDQHFRCFQVPFRNVRDQFLSFQIDCFRGIIPGLWWRPWTTFAILPCESAPYMNTVIDRGNYRGGVPEFSPATFSCEAIPARSFLHVENIA